MSALNGATAATFSAAPPALACLMMAAPSFQYTCVAVKAIRIAVIAAGCANSVGVTPPLHVPGVVTAGAGASSPAARDPPAATLSLTLELDPPTPTTALEPPPALGATPEASPFGEFH